LTIFTNLAICSYLSITCDVRAISVAISIIINAIITNFNVSLASVIWSIALCVIFINIPIPIVIDAIITF